MTTSRPIWSNRARRLTIACLVGLAAWTAVAADDNAEDSDRPFRYRGLAYVGAFFVSSVDSSLAVFSQDLPLGARIDLSKDLGVRESVVIPRISFAYRFSRKHMINFGWYDLDQEASRTLSRTIPIFGEEFEIGTTVTSRFKTEIYKLQYNWLFHSDDKITLGLGMGFFVGDITAGIRQTPFITPNPRGIEPTTVGGSVTAPLPVVGGRLGYNVTPKLSFLATADWFFINYDRYRGLLADLQAFAFHRTFKHVGFGGGINLQTTNAEFDDEGFLWEFEDSFIGVTAVLTVFW